VGSALIETLKDGLGEKFTPETEKAWSKTYNYVASQMKIGMNEIAEKKIS
jgi:hemoglobin-like flavoprotein